MTRVGPYPLLEADVVAYYIHHWLTQPVVFCLGGSTICLCHEFCPPWWCPVPWPLERPKSNQWKRDENGMSPKRGKIPLGKEIRNLLNRLIRPDLNPKESFIKKFGFFSPWCNSGLKGLTLQLIRKWHHSNGPPLDTKQRKIGSTEGRSPREFDMEDSSSRTKSWVGEFGFQNPRVQMSTPHVQRVAMDKRHANK